VEEEKEGRESSEEADIEENQKVVASLTICLGPRYFTEELSLLRFLNFQSFRGTNIYLISAPCNMNKIERNLHATGGHAGKIRMRLAAIRVQFVCDWRPVAYNFCMR
jgi:hypothetical protein